MEFLAPLAETPLARALILSPTLYLFVNAAHILGIAILFGAIFALDLRLLGFGKAMPLVSAAPYLSKLSAIGVLIAVLTGVCLFSVRPVEYATNPAFLAKLGLVALGLLNVAIQHSSGIRRAIFAGQVPAAARLSAILSIVVWISAVIAGRWIGFI
jgi:hypothetical protein